MQISPLTPLSTPAFRSSTCNRRIGNLLGSLLLFITLIAPSFGATLPPVQLAWNKNPEYNIVGYELRYGTVRGSYPHRINAGMSTSASVKGLQQGVTYYFVVVARNNRGMTSPESKVVAYQSNGRTSKPPSGKITSPAGDLTINPGESVDFSGKGTDAKGKSSVVCRWDFGTGSGVAKSKRRAPGKRKFNVPGTYKVAMTVTDSKGQADPTPATRTIVVRAPTYRTIPHKGWKLKFVDSEETQGYAATNAFDGVAGTFWHSQFTNVTAVRYSHEIQIDMGAVRNTAGFRYLPRQDGPDIGNVGTYQFYVSMDGVKWGNPVAAGTFGTTPDLKQTIFKMKKGRFVRLVSYGDDDCNVAELQVMELKKAKKPKKKKKTKNTKKKSSAAAMTAMKTLSSPADDTPDRSPASAPPLVAIEVIDGRKYLSLTFPKPPMPDGTKRTVQVSSNLLDWFSGGNHTTVLIDNERTLKVRDNTPWTRERKRHIRLKSVPR